MGPSPFLPHLPVIRTNLLRLPRSPRIRPLSRLNVQSRLRHESSALDDFAQEENEFILSILQASPSIRDSRSYMASFAPPLPPTPVRPNSSEIQPPLPPDTTAATTTTTTATSKKTHNNLVTSLLNPIVLRPALVKIQGPFTDIQLNSVAKGMAHLQKLGLVSVLIIDRDDLPAPHPGTETHETTTEEAHRHRTLITRDLERVVDCLVRHRAPARPILATVARISEVGEVVVEEEGLEHVQRALEEGEIPVLMPVALDETCRSRRVDANQLILALARGMASSGSRTSSQPLTQRKIDLTPMRLLIINREGGIPSYARVGLPHLSINLSSEQDYINSTFLPRWRSSHPTALSNLQLSSDCLEYMPKEASALIVSHRSPAALIANLITNKPAHSVSLPHALLAQNEKRITRDTPTLIRRGMPVKVLRSMAEIDRNKLTSLLEKSFGRTLDQKGFYTRLEKDLDFLIVIGDYAGAALVTHEGNPIQDICYLDKFAVLPSHQGDGTVDFLWVALRDETYGLGLLDASNPSEGSLSGKGKGRDLVWRSRSDNPVNKWYAERSCGHITMGRWKLFWCDAEERVSAYAEGGQWGQGGLVRVIEDGEKGRLDRWGPVIEGIKSAWA